jgi:hypothetical protein
MVDYLGGFTMSHRSRNTIKGMNVPIKFPTDAKVIVEEAVRFRALTPQARVQSIRALIAAGALMMHRSPKAAFLRAYTEEQEAKARQAIKEFVARHGG